MTKTEWVGWISSLVLVATLSAQVNRQWESRSVTGVSRWLYAGQLLAEAGFVAYSALLRSWVFLVTNAALLVLNLVGLVLYWRRKRAKGRTEPS